MSVKLPVPLYDSGTSIEESLKNRSSVREYKDFPVALSEVSQLLWAGQGITRKNYFRTAPSAGALYPLEIYLATGNVTGLRPGIYRYKPKNHELEVVIEGDRRPALGKAALGQPCVAEAACVIVISAVYERVTKKYMKRGERYADMEAGHAAQNICLQAYSLKLGSVIVGAFNDNEVREIMKMKESEVPLCLIPAGKI